MKTKSPLQKLALAVCSDEDRPQMRGVYLCPNHPYAVATDGHQLVAMRHEGGQRGRVRDDVFCKDTTAVAANYEGSTYVDYVAVLPKSSVTKTELFKIPSMFAKAPPPKHGNPEDTFGMHFTPTGGQWSVGSNLADVYVDPFHLRGWAGEVVRVDYFDEHSPLLVTTESNLTTYTPTSWPDLFALIMPVRVPK